MNETFLITGAKGYIGMRLCEYLSISGKSFRPSTRESESPYSINFEKVEFLPALFKDIDTIVHTAGIAHETKRKKDIKLYEQVNGYGVIEFAKAASLNGVKKFVFISSVKSEENTVYGSSKRLAEKGLVELSMKTDMIISIIRPALVYSKAPKGNLKKLKKSIEMGIFPPPPEMNNKKALIHLDDLCVGILKIAEKNLISGKCFTITDEVEYSTRIIYEDLCSSLGKAKRNWTIPFWLVSLMMKNSSAARKLFSNDFFESVNMKELGFTPSFTLKDINESLF